MDNKDKIKQREYCRNWMQKRRQEWIGQNGPCKRCGSWEDLEGHHKDPETKISHRVWSWTKKKREKELRKCEVLCFKCHVIAGREYRDSKITKYIDGMDPSQIKGHGAGTYDRGCRCPVCVKWNRDRVARQVIKKNNVPLCPDGVSLDEIS